MGMQSRNQKVGCDNCVCRRAIKKFEMAPRNNGRIGRIVNRAKKED